MTTHHLTTLRTLRECQSRSAQEQQILSGRDWLFVTALVQFLSALYPAYCWMMNIFYRSAGQGASEKNMYMAIGMLSMCAFLLALWGWGKYAPYRAACAAFGVFLFLQTYVALYHPNHMLDGIASKVLVLLGLIMAVRTGYRRRHSC